MAAAFAAAIAKQKGGGGGGLGALMGGGGAKPGGQDMKKYQRMKKMGLPLNSILNKMRMDGCDQAAIDAFGGQSGKRVKAVEDEKQVMPESARPGKKMKPFHWAKLNYNQSQATIWKDCDSMIPPICLNYKSYGK